LDTPLLANGVVVVPKGAEAIGRVIEVSPSGRFRGRPVIALELTALNFDGKSIAIQTSTHREGGSSRTKETSKIAGGGTAAGTIIGAIVGHPWLGAGVGVATGFVVQTVRKPEDIQIPVESMLVFTLQTPLPVDTPDPFEPNGLQGESQAPW